MRLVGLFLVLGAMYIIGWRSGRRAAEKEAEWLATEASYWKSAYRSTVDEADWWKK